MALFSDPELHAQPPRQRLLSYLTVPLVFSVPFPPSTHQSVSPSLIVPHTLIHPPTLCLYVFLLLGVFCRRQRVKNTRAFPGETEANDLADLGLALERSKADQQHLYEAAAAAGGGGGTADDSSATATAAAAPAAAPEVDLLGLMGGEEGGGGGGGSEGVAAGGGVKFQTGTAVPGTCCAYRVCELWWARALNCFFHE